MKIAATACALMLALTACASIVKGSGPQAITISSTPSDASVKIINKAGENISNGKTPYTVSLNRSRGYFAGEDYTITLNKEGFKDQTLKVTSSVNGWYVGGNLLFGGLIGWLIVDPLTGAMWTLSPGTVTASLASEAHVRNDGPLTMTVVLLQDVSPEMMKSAQPVIR